MYKNKPYYVVDATHHAMGRGRGIINAKLRDIVTGNVIPVTFKAGEEVEPANVSQSDAQYLYSDEENLYFMNPQTYEQYSMPKKNAQDVLEFLKEGEVYTLYFYDGNAVAINMPKVVVLEVTQAPPGVKGDSASSATKKVTLETGLVIDAPLFIKAGDKIKINVEAKSYVDRVG